MLQSITSSQPTFICIDTPDESLVVHRAKILDSQKQILEVSPETRKLTAGRPHIQVEIEKRLGGRVINASVSHGKDDIRYHLVKLSQDEAPDAMDESLQADLLDKILQGILVMSGRLGANTRN